jgi:hypothetical protein
MATNNKSSKAIKGVAVIIVLGAIIAAGLYFFNSDKNTNVEVEKVDIESNDVVVERLTKTELEESINNTIDGFVPEEIFARLSPKEQKVIVKNNPDACIESGICEVWERVFLQIYSRITVVEEECVFDSCNRLETLVIIAE